MVHECILSREGTTQGYPLAMAMYAMATLPMIQRLQQEADIQQVWYADNSAGCGDYPATSNAVCCHLLYKLLMSNFEISNIIVMFYV
jgi:hypothetical protein